MLCPNCHQQFRQGRQLSSHFNTCTSHAKRRRFTTTTDPSTSLLANPSNNHSLANANGDSASATSYTHTDDYDDDVERGSHSNNSIAVPMVASHFQQSCISTMFTRDDVVHLQLLSLCDQLHLPMYAFDAILDWGQQAYLQQYQFNLNVPSRTRIMDNLYKRFNMESIKPSTAIVQLEGGASANVVTFPFKEMFYSLLGDEDLMDPDNLLLPQDGPSPVILPNKTDALGDITSGSWYQEAYHNICLESNDFICPIILFIDKTHIDGLSRWTLEPVMFTLGIFNCATRNLSHAWRPLGLISDLSKVSCN